jgi:hypothetical protein
MKCKRQAKRLLDGDRIREYECGERRQRSHGRGPVADYESRIELQMQHRVLSF